MPSLQMEYIDYMHISFTSGVAIRDTQACKLGQAADNMMRMMIVPYLDAVVRMVDCKQRGIDDSTQCSIISQSPGPSVLQAAPGASAIGGAAQVVTGAVSKNTLQEVGAGASPAGLLLGEAEAGAAAEILIFEHGNIRHHSTSAASRIATHLAMVQA